VLSKLFLKTLQYKSGAVHISKEHSNIGAQPGKFKIPGMLSWMVARFILFLRIMRGARGGITDRSLAHFARLVVTRRHNVML
jgi:hypothetical protein